MAGKGQYKLTTFSKILILVLIVALVAGGLFVGVQKGLIKTKNGSNNGNGGGVSADADGNVINTEKTSEDTINL